jgi:hypothetical protein
MDTLKYILMVLKKDTSLGLSYGQIIATIAILISLFGIAMQANMRMSQIEISQRTAFVRIEVLEVGRQTNAESIIRFEEKNIVDHRNISDKLDKILFMMAK